MVQPRGEVLARLAAVFLDQAGGAAAVAGGDGFRDRLVFVPDGFALAVLLPFRGIDGGVIWPILLRRNGGRKTP